MIRLAQTGDIAEIARIHVASWQAAYKNLLPEEFLARLDAKNRETLWHGVLTSDPHSILIVENENRVAGFCHFTPSRHGSLPDALEITSIYLDPSLFRQGLGTRLISSAIAEATKANYKTVILWVLESNTPARLFYEKHGFSPEGSSKVETGPGFQLNEALYIRSIP